MNDTLKKVSFSTLMFMMVFSLSFGSFVPRVSAALMGGDLVKGPNSDAVYYINGTTSTKHVFPDAKTYFTWYTNFDGVKAATIAELDMYPTGAPVSYRPGTQLVTHPNTAKVYAVEAGAKLRAIPNEATAAALYGAQWATWVRDVHELTFGNYTVGSDLTSSMHSEGTLLQKTGDSTIYMVEGGKIRPFASTTAFDANNLDYDDVVEVPSISGYTTGSSVTGAETFATIAGGGTGTTVPGGTVTVSLSPNTPAANTVLLGGAARVPMLTVRFTAGANAITVDSMTILRGGIASDTEFTDFDLLDASTMLPLNNYSKSLNSAHQAVFNDDFTVPANGTMDVIVAANMVASLATLAGEYPAMSVSSIALKNNATMSGTLPITGNVMLTNGTITVGTATIIGGSNNPAASTQEVGTKDFVVSSIKITNNSTATAQTLVVKSITFTNNGSSAPEDVENIRLINANTGTTLATMAKATADKLSFTNLNLEILKGNNVNLDLKLDIKSGSLRTISYEVDKQGDVVVFDNLRGFNVLPTYTGVTTSPFYNPADTTIGNGKLRVESIAIQDTNVAEGTNGVLLGKFKFVMAGEAGNITALGIKVATTTTGVQDATEVISDITNLTVKDPAGNTVAGPKDAAANSLNDGFTATTTDTITVPIGETIYSVYADLTSDWTANDAIQLSIHPEAITLKGDITGNTITPTPSGAISSTSMTIKAATLALSLGSSPAAGTVVAGSQDFEFGQLVMDATNSGSDIRVTQFPVNVVTTDGSAPSDVSGIQIFDGATQIPVSSSSQTCSGTTCSTIVSNATTTLTIASGNLTIPKGTSKTVRIVGDVGTATTTGSFQFNLGGTGFTLIDAQGQSATATYTAATSAAQTIAGGGTLVISSAQDPAAAQLVGGTTVNVFQFDLQAKHEAMKINSVAFLIGAPDGGDAGDKDEVEELQLWESGGSSALGTLTVSANQSTITSATPINLNLGQSKTFIVKAKVRDPHLTSVATSGEGFDITMTNVDVDGQAVGSSSVTLSGNGAVSKSFHVYDSVPVVALGSITADQIISSASLVDLFKFSVTANSAGPVGLFKFTFGVSTSSAVILSTTGYTLYENNSSGSLGTLLSDTTDMRVVVNDASDGHIVEARFDPNNDSANAMNSFNYGEHLIINGGATKYFTLQGTLSAISATVNDDSISTVLGGDEAFAATAQENAAAIDGDDAADDFIWSDLNFSTSYTALTATTIVGWFNGYRVSGLNNNSTTAQIQTD